MPLIRIRRRTDKVSDAGIRSIVDALPAVVAKALSCDFYDLLTAL